MDIGIVVTGAIVLFIGSWMTAVGRKRTTLWRRAMPWQRWWTYGTGAVVLGLGWVITGALAIAAGVRAHR